LSQQDVENGWRSTTTSSESSWGREKNSKKEHAPTGSVDLGENLSFGGIIVSSKLAILHTETIAPEGKMSNRGLLS
jgi:hypothetical protein